MGPLLDLGRLPHVRWRRFREISHFVIAQHLRLHHKTYYLFAYSLNNDYHSCDTNTLCFLRSGKTSDTSSRSGNSGANHDFVWQNSGTLAAVLPDARPFGQWSVVNMLHLETPRCRDACNELEYAGDTARKPLAISQRWSLEGT